MGKATPRPQVTSPSFPRDASNSSSNTRAPTGAAPVDTTRYSDGRGGRRTSQRPPHDQQRTPRTVQKRGTLPKRASDRQRLSHVAGNFSRILHLESTLFLTGWVRFIQALADKIQEIFESVFVIFNDLMNSSGQKSKLLLQELSTTELKKE